MKKIASMVLLAGILFTFLSGSVSASSYKGYTYNYWNEAVPSQIGYEPSAVYTGTDFSQETGSLNNPQDLAVDAKNQIYILDSGNKRVVILDSSFKTIRIIKEFFNGKTPVELIKPTGLFVDDNGLIYITDPDSACVYVSDIDGNIRQILGKPDTELLADELEFQPRKVLADSSGMIYVTATGVYQGALLYNQNGLFAGFYGSNTVEVTASLLLDRLWKNLLSDKQVSNIARYIPEEFTSFDIDGSDFIYTVTQTASISQKVKKLNPMGNNILEAVDFGEQEKLYISGKLTSSRFVDVAVEKSGNINVLDQQNNRVFQYDREGQLLFIFGGTGTQSGTFKSPSALDTLGDKILVLDSQKSNLTVFEPTAFGKSVRGAVDLYNDGQYEQAYSLWSEIIKQDANYETAYISIAKALMAEKKYKEAAEYFKTGNDREGNSEAFQAYRNSIIQKYFPGVCLAVVLLVGLFIWAGNRKKKVRPEPSSGKKRSNPLRMLMHPIEEAEEMKQQKSGSLLYSVIILLFWFLSAVFKYSMTGFRFNSSNMEDMNVLLLFLGTIPVFAVWVVSNWSVCTLMDGKGHLKDIWISNAYCLIPYTGSVFLYIMMSRFLVINEIFFLNGILILGAGWSILSLLGALGGIHEYSFGQTIVSVLLTLLGVLIVIFLILLVTSLMQQAYAFVYSLVNEILYHLR